MPANYNSRERSLLIVSVKFADVACLAKGALYADSSPGDSEDIKRYPRDPGEVLRDLLLLCGRVVAAPLLKIVEFYRRILVAVASRGNTVVVEVLRVLYRLTLALISLELARRGVGCRLYGAIIVIGVIVIVVAIKVNSKDRGSTRLPTSRLCGSLPYNGRVLLEK